MEAKSRQAASMISPFIRYWRGGEPVAQFAAEGKRRKPAAAGDWQDRRRERRASTLCKRRFSALAVCQQEKIAARTAEEQATSKGKRSRKLKPADGSVDPDAVANVTDPDNEIMKTRWG